MQRLLDEVAAKERRVQELTHYINAVLVRWFGIIFSLFQRGPISVEFILIIIFFIATILRFWTNSNTNDRARSLGKRISMHQRYRPPAYTG